MPSFGRRISRNKESPASTSDDRSEEASRRTLSPSQAGPAPRDPSPSVSTNAPEAKGQFSLLGKFNTTNDLWWAVEYGKISDVRKCLNAGLSADFCRRETVFQKVPLRTARSLIDKAVVKGDIDIVSLLLQRGAATDGSPSMHEVAEHEKKWKELKDKRMRDLKEKPGNSTNEIHNQNPDPLTWTTPLHLAAESGNEAMVNILVEKGHVDLELWDSFGRSPLQSLVIAEKLTNEKRLAMVRVLLDKGAQIDRRSARHLTALHIAALVGNIEITKLLLGSGASIDLQDEDGDTPLTLAAMKKHFKMVRLLAERGAEVDVLGEKGQTAFFRAASRLDEELMSILADLGANVDARDANMCTALIRAAMAKNETLLRVLLGQGVLLDCQDVDGWTALYAAMVNQDDNLAQLLIANGAEFSGREALHQAARTGSAFLTRTVLARGVGPDTLNDRYETPLHEAATYGRRAVVHLLLAAGANLHVEDLRSQTPLHRAIRMGHSSIVRELVGKGARVNARAFDCLPDLSKINSEALKSRYALIFRYLRSSNPRWFFFFDWKIFDIFTASTATPIDDIIEPDLEWEKRRLQEKQGKTVAYNGESGETPSSGEGAGSKAKEETIDPFEASIPKTASGPGGITQHITIQNKQNEGAEALKLGLGLVGSILQVASVL